MAKTKTKEPLMETIDGKDCIDKDNNQERPAHWFKPGNQLAKGHKRGRAKLTKQFVDDLQAEWHNRGNQALQDLTSKDLVNACIAILPKDVLVHMNDKDKANWVINAAPLSIEAWSAQHGLETKEARS